MLTLIRKELRSSAWVVALGLLAFGWLFVEMTGTPTWFGRSNQGDQRLALGVMWYWFITMGFAGLLGLMMAGEDSRSGTWSFVLFRPFSRRRYVGAKLIVGVALAVLMSGVPAFAFMIWAAKPGRWLVPWDWSYAQIPVETMGWSVVVFLGGFLSSMRLASWWWSRLWPLATTVLLGLLFGLVCLAETFPESITPSPVQYWGLSVVFSAALTSLILHASDERDFS